MEFFPSLCSTMKRTLQTIVNVLQSKATGSGGDSMIQNIYWDEKFVYIVLHDGQELKLARNQGLTWVYV